MKEINNNENIAVTAEQEEQGTTINLKEFFQQCLDKWYWFAISVVVCLGIGAYYVMKTTPTYERSALIQIRDDKHGAPMNNDFANTFADLGMFSSSADIYNEIVAIKSPRLMAKVVDNLDLNVNYTTKKGLKTIPVYGAQLPYIVEFIDGGDNGATLTMEVAPGDTTGVLTDFVKYMPGGVKEEFDDFKANFSTAAIDTVATPIGRLVLKPNANHIATQDNKDVKINISYISQQAAVDNLAATMNASLAEEHATVIKINITDESPERAEDILNELIAVYNQSWVDDRNQIARATSQFINQRLVGLEGELSDVDSDISSFKSQNMLPDVDEASSLYLQQANKTSDEILELNNQLSMARYVRDYLNNPTHTTSIMPANSGTGTQAIDNQISEYNKIMIERNSLAASSSDNHPRVKQYDATLSEMRAAVISSIDNQIVSLNTAISNLQRSQANANARIAANPSQAKYLLAVGRQQKVKESLYLYLLQKREENELGQTFAPYNTRILQDATGARVPVAPRKAIIMLTALIIGLLIPMAILYVYEMLNTRVRSRRDLDGLSAPFVGEIPLLGEKKKFRKHQNKPLGIMVSHGKNDAINEAFRLMRSNLEFMTRGDEKPTKVIMVTSAIPGSGKTFTSMNLASALALKNKKVLLIDLDLRRHSMSNELSERSRQGVSTYLSGNSDIPALITHNIEGIDNLDFLAAGPVPPNPAELIGSKRLESLIEYARNNYDVVVLDCPPTEAVEDARTISPLTDMTLFVIRIGNLDRSFLPEIEKMYKENRYSRMAMVLNGAPTTGAYAYRYGYNYSYNS